MCSLVHHRGRGFFSALASIGNTIKSAASSAFNALRSKVVPQPVAVSVKPATLGPYTFRGKPTSTELGYSSLQPQIYREPTSKPIPPIPMYNSKRIIVEPHYDQPGPPVQITSAKDFPKGISELTVRKP